MVREINEYEDVIDSRDIDKRIDELADACEGYDVDPADVDGSDVAELASLRAVREECQQYTDEWKYGVTLIRDSYFTDYAQEEAEQTSDIGANELALQWPWRHIDWDAAADELKNDYTEVTYNGVDYWYRSC